MSTELRVFTEAEQEELTAVVSAARVAVAAQNKFVNFLRKQHAAPEKDGWLLNFDGFELPASPPAPDKTPPADGVTPNGRKKANKAASKILGVTEVTPE